MAGASVSKHQTVFPESTHESGELIEWDEGGGPTTIDRETLQKQFDTLSAACLLVKHWPKKGSRHDAALALAGGLLRGGMEVEDAEKLICLVCRMVRDLIDPNEAPLRRPPKNEQDLMIAATNGWIVGFDNLSGIRPGLSDALCGLATGAGFATRELYTDGEEKIFSARRPVMANGIDDIATRSDLADRTIHLTLPTIDPRKRRSETELNHQFDQTKPQILGALLDAVAGALRNAPHVKLSESPRMADFAIFATAAEQALGWPKGSFMRAYESNRADAQSQALESSAVGPALLRLIEKRGTWSGTATKLRGALDAIAYHTERNRTGWPQYTRGVGIAVRRLAPALRSEGIKVTYKHEGRGNEKRQIIQFKRIAGVGS